MSKLNIGCGLDYREGFINIDGSDVLPRVDKVIDLSQEALDAYYEANSIDHILCSDFLEHHFHWEAVALLKQFFSILRPGGSVEIHIPDSEFILNSDVSIEEKLRWLYGAQDVQRGVMDASRKKYPQFFCHKYGWTRDRIKAEMEIIGFRDLRFKQLAQSKNFSFVTYAVKI